MVEDDPVARTYLSEILSDRGHRVEALPDGSEAAERFARKGHALVFLDRVLPDTSGVAICEEIRALPESRDTIIVFVTGTETQEALEEALEAGADDYVVKPAPPDLLATRIAIAERRAAELRENRRIQAELRQASYRDTLTGLGNRQMLEDQLGRAAKRFKRSEEYLFAVLILDIDGFHGINEEFGESVANRVLREVGDRIGTCLRDEDTIVRIAADEFGVHLDDLTNESDPTRVAGRIQEEMARPVEVGSRKVQVTLSIGIALPSTDAGEVRVEALIRDARKAVVRAKSGGRGEIQIYDPAVHARALARVALEAEIRNALESDELSLRYQPILELATGEVHALEALLRWERPGGELTLPSTFIPVAEETGLIVPLGWWTLETACRQTRAWREEHPREHPLNISVNVSGKQFTLPDVHEIVARTLDRTGFAGDGLHLELTETAVMSDPDTAVATMNHLRDLGVHVHVDDFGTGYSSLAYLCRLPIDTLKVDRAFINAMVESRENLEVVRTIIRLAKTLEFSVVAEGVETKEQEDLLREMECDYVQGYRYYRPLTADRIPELLNGSKPSNGGSRARGAAGSDGADGGA